MSDMVIVLPGARVASGATAAYLTALRRDPCVYCGSTADVLDHITPALRGCPRDGRRRGGDSWTNLAPACATCNLSKGAKSLLGFLGYTAWRASPSKRILDLLVEERNAWVGLGR